VIRSWAISESSGHTVHPGHVDPDGSGKTWGHDWGNPSSDPGATPGQTSAGPTHPGHGAILRSSFTLKRPAFAATLVAVCALGLAGSVSAEARPLHGTLVGVFAFGGCPTDAPTGALCLHDDVTGRMSHLGSVTGSFDVIIDASAVGADGCAPISKRGNFRSADGDRLDLVGEGTFCFATAVATYTYTITGGTGRLDEATGTGTWLVPAPTTFDGVAGEGKEFLNGTIDY
jgi:hypothetical protein